MFDIRSVGFALNAKFHAKIKILKLCTKAALCWYFWVAVLKSIVIFEISALKIFKLQRFVQRLKILQFVLNFSLGIFRQQF